MEKKNELKNDILRLFLSQKDFTSLSSYNIAEHLQITELQTEKLLEEMRYSDNPLLKIDNLPTGSYHKYRAEIPERGRTSIEEFLKAGGYQD